MSLLRKANVQSEEKLKPQVKIWREKPSSLNDNELMDAADYLREERAMLAEKLIKAGVLEPEWLDHHDHKDHS